MLVPFQAGSECHRGASPYVPCPMNVGCSASSPTAIWVESRLNAGMNDCRPRAFLQSGHQRRPLDKQSRVCSLPRSVPGYVSPKYISGMPKGDLRLTVDLQNLLPARPPRRSRLLPPIPTAFTLSKMTPCSSIFSIWATKISTLLKPPQTSTGCLRIMSRHRNLDSATAG